MVLLHYLILPVLITAQIDNKPGSLYCRNRRLCSKNQVWDRSSRAAVQVASCYCDDACIFFNDCCIDSVNQHAQTFTDDFICSSEGLAESHYLQQKCPPRTSKKLRDQCEQTSTDDPFTLIPVTSRKTAFTYRNIFCAVCNKEPISALWFWNPVVKCSLSKQEARVMNGYILRNKLRFNMKTKNWNLDPLKFYLQNRYSNLSCHTLYSIPPDINIIQKCQEHVYWCDETWQKPNIEHKCVEGYTSLVYRKSDSYAYKNIYCAICNHVPLNELQCDVTEDLINWDKDTGEKLMSYYFKGELSECSPVKLNELFDNFNQCPSNEILINGKCEPKQSLLLPSSEKDKCDIEAVVPLFPFNRFRIAECLNGFIYDPFQGLCRSFLGKPSRFPPNPFFTTFNKGDQGFKTSSRWHTHRISVHNNAGTPQEESFTRFEFNTNQS